MATTHKKSTEGVQVYPGVRPVTATASAKGGSETPSDVMTGGGKVKSAPGTSEPVDVSRATDKNEEMTKSGKVPRSGTDTAAAMPSQMGMEKSAKMAAPKVATVTGSGSSRAKPQAQPEKNK